MLLVIIPTFAKIFAEFGGELPLPTRIVMGMSDFLQQLLVGCWPAASPGSSPPSSATTGRPRGG